MTTPPPTAPPHKSYVVSAGGTAIIILLSTISLFAILEVISDIVDKRDVATWAETTAVVFGSRVDDVGHKAEAQGAYRWRPTISFTYEVDGTSYKSDNKRFVEYMKRGDAQAVVEEHPPQSRLTIYYDPEDPEDVVFDNDPPWVKGDTFGFLIPSVMFWIYFGGWLVPAMLRDRRARRQHAADAG